MPTKSTLHPYRCCFTGHRPEKLTMPEAEVKAALEAQIRVAIGHGFQTFISGMSRGVDIWAAEIVLWLRNEGRKIRLVCAVPYPDFEARWGAAWQTQYRCILDEADWIEYICPTYSPNCFQSRNEWMVNHAARMIAVYNGTGGGTRNTLKYAESQGLSIIKIYGV